MNLLKPFFVISSITMISRILGFIRDILLAAFIGAGPITDAFFVAFKLPNFLRRMFAEGAFNAAFIPFFANILEKNGLNKAKEFAQETLTLIIISLLLLVALMETIMPMVLYVLAPGFKSNSNFDLAVELTRITFPYIIFISLVSLMAGILNSIGKFIMVAFVPVILNIFFILAILYGIEYTKTPVHALAFAVTFAGMVQLIWLTIGLHRSNLSLRLKLTFKFSKKIFKLIKLMIPGFIGAGVVQINLLTDIVIASFLPGGSISFLYFAERVSQLPVGIFGVAIGTALLPLISRQIIQNKIKEAVYTQNRSVELSLILTIPATFALIILAFPLISTLFERGFFSSIETEATSLALIGYAFGIPAYVLIKVFTPSYFARQDTATPVKIAVAAVIINLLLNLTLVWWLQHVGLAIATSIASWFNIILLSLILYRRKWWNFDRKLIISFFKVCISSILMSFVIILADNLLYFDESIEIFKILKLCFLVLLGISIFLTVLYSIGGLNLKQLLNKNN
ncbi:murein biosynthesis integral membrane protein MurJ [Alphaproteobacteria bacterium]|nr:murein biosynthesis integral membrane protein MurJ [Alphaproteobacteria bacterium]